MGGFPVFSQEQVQGFAGEINGRGFARLPGYIAANELKRMQGFVTDAVTRSGNQYVDFRSVEAVAGSGLEALAQSPELLDLLHSMFACGTGKAPPAQKPYQLLRCLAGETGRQNSYVFHYDSYVVTALVPIHIPTQGLAGDLLVYPNMRGIRSSYLHNVLDKLWLKAPFIQRLLLAGVSRGWRRATRRDRAATRT